MDRNTFDAYWTGKGHKATDLDYKAYQLGQQMSENTVQGQQNKIANQIMRAAPDGGDGSDPVVSASKAPTVDHHPTLPYLSWGEYRGNRASMGYAVDRKNYDQYLRHLSIHTQGDHDISQQNIHNNKQGTGSIAKGEPDHVHDQKQGTSTAKGAGSDFVDENTSVHHDSVVPGWKPKFKDYGEDRGPPPIQTQGKIRPKPKPRPDSGDEIKPGRDTCTRRGDCPPGVKPPKPAPSDPPPVLPKQRTQTYPYPYKNLPFDPTRLPPELGDDFYSGKYQDVLQKWGRDNFDRYEKKQPLLPKPLPPPETMLREQRFVKGKQKTYKEVLADTLKKVRFIPARDLKTSPYVNKKPYYMEIDGVRQPKIYDIQGNLYDETGPPISDIGFLNQSEGYSGAVDNPEKIRDQAWARGWDLLGAASGWLGAVMKVEKLNRGLMRIAQVAQRNAVRNANRLRNLTSNPRVGQMSTRGVVRRIRSRSHSSSRRSRIRSRTRRRSSRTRTSSLIIRSRSSTRTSRSSSIRSSSSSSIRILRSSSYGLVMSNVALVVRI